MTCSISASRGKAIEMEDVKFHQCVRLSRFENDRTISFIPPDGEFELMSYRLSTPVKPLIWVEATVESHKGSRVEYIVKCKAQFKRRSTANNVEIWVPVPDDADTPKFRVSAMFIWSSDSSSSESTWTCCAISSGVDRECTICPRQVRVRMEDQATRWWSRVPHESSLWSSERQERCVIAIRSLVNPIRQFTILVYRKRATYTTTAHGQV